MNTAAPQPRRWLLWLMLPLAVVVIGGLLVCVVLALLKYPPPDTAFGHGILGLWALTTGRGRG